MTARRSTPADPTADLAIAREALEAIAAHGCVRRGVSCCDSPGAPWMTWCHPCTARAALDRLETP